MGSVTVAMTLIGPHDVVYIPGERGKCPACGGGLFAVVHTYLADTGEPVKSGIHVGCVDCDAEIADPLRSELRDWISSNFRVKT